MKCVACESLEGTPKLVGDEYLSLCAKCDWGVDDINAADAHGKSWGDFFQRLYAMGMKFTNKGKDHRV